MLEPAALSIYLPRAGAFLAIVVVTLIGLRLLGSLRGRVVRRMKERASARDVSVAEQHQRIETVVAVGFDVLRAMVLAFAAIAALAQVGVSVQPLVAGAGLAGAALALGSQTVVKDFVAGFFILLESRFVIGDTVVVGAGLAGVVEKMTLRVTVLRDADGSVHIVPNGSIVAVTNKTYRWTRSAALLLIDASASQDDVRSALARAAEATKARDASTEILLDDLDVAGPLDVKGTAVEWSISVKTRPGEASRVKTWILEDALRELSKAGLALRG